MRFQLRIRTTVGLVVVGLALGSVAARASDVTVALAAHDQGWEPAEIEAGTGARIRLEITNKTAAAIEFESFELNRERVVQPGQTAAVYVSDLKEGTYEFFDDFHQERKGKLVVR